MLNFNPQAMNPELTRIIERYLNGELSETDKIAFEQKLSESDALRAALELQKTIHEGAKRSFQRQTVKQTGKRYHFRKKLIKAIIATSIAGAVAAAGWLVWKNTNALEGELSESEMAALIQQLDKLAPMEFVPNEYFEISSKDTVVLSENGVLLSVPEGAFLLNGKVYSGRKIVQWQEAMDASTIVKGGLSTMSGDRLLETQGMFGIQAFTPEGKKLQVNPKVGVYVQVPVDELKEGMQLFEGKPGKNGVIDWQNPQPLEKLPVSADMRELDFYPPGYEAKLDELKWKTGKKERDSLYLSFEKGVNYMGGQQPISILVEQSTNKTLNVHFEWLNSKEGLITASVDLPPGNYIVLDNVGNSASIDLEVDARFMTMLGATSATSAKTIELSDGTSAHGTNEISRKVRVNTSESFAVIGKVRYQVFDRDRVLATRVETFSLTIGGNLSGKELFEIKCATCHQPHKEATGPKLFNIRQTWANGGAKPGSIYKWVQNFENAAKTDPYALMVSRKKVTDMLRFPELQHTEIDAIFDYIDGISGDHIPPSKVLAFWNPKFNNTILATRDFEKRMRVIHNTCCKDVLEKYTNNLNKPLHEIDQMLVEMGYTEFSDFAAERVGGIQLDNPHMNNLAHFYDQAVSQLKEQVKKDKAFLRKLEMDWDRKLRKERSKETDRTAKRDAKALQEEYKLNLNNVYEQLGKPNPLVFRQLGKTVGFRITGNSAIYNIDKYVMDATVARQSTTITDATTGKTAQITYNDFSVSVDKPEQYERLFLYLFPKELNSFQRIDPKGKGVFDYPLNNDIQYDLAVIGINESGYFIYRKTGLNKGALGTVSLEKVSEATFNAMIEELNSGRNKKSMSITNELKWLAVEKEDYKVQRLRKEQATFRSEVRSAVFPCEEIGVEYDATAVDFR